jgi:hypothetical protein
MPVGTAAARVCKAPREPERLSAPNRLAIFIARAEARAMLWGAGEFDLHEAVDKLQADAERDGLVAEFGQDRVQQLIAATFAPLRDDLPRDKDQVPEPQAGFSTETRYHVPIATLQAAEFLMQQKDPAHLRAWLSKHTAQERAGILQHLERRKRARAK